MTQITNCKEAKKTFDPRFLLMTLTEKNSSYLPHLCTLALIVKDGQISSPIGLDGLIKKPRWVCKNFLNSLNREVVLLRSNPYLNQT